MAVALLAGPLGADWMWRGTGRLREQAPKTPVAAPALPGAEVAAEAPAPSTAALVFPTREPDRGSLKADAEPGPLPVALVERAARSEPLGRALEDFQAGEFARASRTCRRFLRSRKAGEDGPFAQFLWAASEFRRGELNRSYDLFEDLVRKFPANELGPQVARWELAIATRFLTGHKEKLLGLRVRDMRYDAQVILERLIERYPYGQLTDRLLTRLGDGYRAVGDYGQALLYYDRMLRDFPRSPLARQVEFGRLESLLLDFSSAGHDVGGLREAEAGLRAFLSTYSQDPRAQRARQYLRTVRELEAEHAYRVAEFYVLGQRWESARRYYRLVRDQFAETTWAARAARRLQQLTPPALTATSEEPVP